MADSDKESLYTPEQCRQLLRNEIKSKVSIKIVTWAIGITAVVAIAISGMVWNSYTNAQEHQDKERERIAQLQQGVLQERRVTDVKLKTLQEDVTEIKSDMKEAQKAQQQIITIMMEIRQDRKDLELKIDRNLEEVKREMKNLSNNNR